jgi:hypothetical protein
MSIIIPSKVDTSYKITNIIRNTRIYLADACGNVSSRLLTNFTGTPAYTLSAVVIFNQSLAEAIAAKILKMPFTLTGGGLWVFQIAGSENAHIQIAFIHLRGVLNGQPGRLVGRLLSFTKSPGNFFRTCKKLSFAKQDPVEVIGVINFVKNLVSVLFEDVVMAVSQSQGFLLVCKKKSGKNTGCEFEKHDLSRSLEWEHTRCKGCLVLCAKQAMNEPVNWKLFIISPHQILQQILVVE